MMLHEKFNVVQVTSQWEGVCFNIGPQLPFLTQRVLKYTHTHTEINFLKDIGTANHILNTKRKITRQLAFGRHRLPKSC